MHSHPAVLRLSTGQEFDCHVIGAPVTTSGELVFTTGMVGYTEALTDPSYFGQILVFTYPLIGNYGVAAIASDLRHPEGPPAGFESSRVQAAGAVIAVDTPEAFHWNSRQSLARWLTEEGANAVVGLDTRELVRLIRTYPGVQARIEVRGAERFRYEGARYQELLTAGYLDPGGENVLPEVSRANRIRLGRGEQRIAILDCGVKWNIIRELLRREVEVEIVPWEMDPEMVDCDAWVLSNGPGNPQNTGDLPARVRKLLQGERPLLGICLGHQILALAAGAATRKLPYGHRSHNQPVVDVRTGRAFLSTQNHGYVVDDATLPAGWQPWFVNANDRTLEGIRHESGLFRSIQFHPEAAGGPRDTAWIVESFVCEVRGENAVAY